MNKILLFILDILYPNRCPVCDEIILYDEIICSKCNENVYQSKADDDNTLYSERLNALKTDEKLLFDSLTTLFYYEKFARDGILSLKSENKNFGIYLGRLLSEKINNNDKLRKADFIVPVPMSRKSLRERGYNQAYVIAKEISNNTGIKVLNNVLFKKKSRAQHTLKASERKLNVSAFFGKECDLTGKNIIVCDDVLTTGSTMNRCAELLKNMNAANVYAAVGTIIRKKE